ncbi:hypothetical protein HYH02_001194 [Chlamydomonas schloesseri]|uniref:Pherophorin domain-containing protein n=1 Tax=Chlamydomonas schloesseri TaxID=2026947 RepID=A0A835WVX0_9CHLO|nr:hypothetical protein HYH02_001194 [Chlamydomonas schloesseri]|eukprot:KAG2454158.1 hypothetical protein HYH02_001194 [Chlamydomonas schloesseri]
MFCFEVQVGACERPKNPCCNADVKKLELDVDVACNKTGFRTFWGKDLSNLKKTPTQPFYDIPDGAPPDGLVLKVTELGLDKSNADGMYICYQYINTGSKTPARCRTPAGLCRRDNSSSADGRVCSVALTSSDNNCCPVTGYTPPTPPSPPSPSSPPPTCTVCVEHNITMVLRPEVAKDAGAVASVSEDICSYLQYGDVFDPLQDQVDPNPACVTAFNAATAKLDVAVKICLRATSALAAQAMTAWYDPNGRLKWLQRLIPSGDTGECKVKDGTAEARISGAPVPTTAPASTAASTAPTAALPLPSASSSTAPASSSTASAPAAPLSWAANASTSISCTTFAPATFTRPALTTATAIALASLPTAPVARAAIAIAPSFPASIARAPFAFATPKTSTPASLSSPTSTTFSFSSSPLTYTTLASTSVPYASIAFAAAASTTLACTAISTSALAHAAVTSAAVSCPTLTRSSFTAATVAIAAIAHTPITTSAFTFTSFSPAFASQSTSFTPRPTFRAASPPPPPTRASAGFQIMIGPFDEFFDEETCLAYNSTTGLLQGSGCDCRDPAQLVKFITVDGSPPYELTSLGPLGPAVIRFVAAEVNRTSGNDTAVPFGCIQQPQPLPNPAVLEDRVTDIVRFGLCPPPQQPRGVGRRLQGRSEGGSSSGNNNEAGAMNAVASAALGAAGPGGGAELGPKRTTYLTFGDPSLGGLTRTGYRRLAQAALTNSPAVVLILRAPDATGRDLCASVLYDTPDQVYPSPLRLSLCNTNLLASAELRLAAIRSEPRNLNRSATSGKFIKQAPEGLVSISYPKYRPTSSDWYQPFTPEKLAEVTDRGPCLFSPAATGQKGEKRAPSDNTTLDVVRSAECSPLTRDLLFRIYKITDVDLPLGNVNSTEINGTITVPEVINQTIKIYQKYVWTHLPQIIPSLTRLNGTRFVPADPTVTLILYGTAFPVLAVEGQELVSGMTRVVLATNFVRANRISEDKPFCDNRYVVAERPDLFNETVQRVYFSNFSTLATPTGRGATNLDNTCDVYIVDYYDNQYSQPLINIMLNRYLSSGNALYAVVPSTLPVDLSTDTAQIRIFDSGIAVDRIVVPPDDLAIGRRRFLQGNSAAVTAAGGQKQELYPRCFSSHWTPFVLHATRTC